MGKYINKGNAGFQSARKGEYIDKSELIAVVNSTLFSERRFSCVTRSRRFGKSMAAKMLCAYYDQTCDSRQLFEDLRIAQNPTFEEHLNKYPVIYLDVTDFTTRFHDESIVKKMDMEIREEVAEVFPDIPMRDTDDLMDALFRVSQSTGQLFVFIIDEWDAICREFTSDTEVMDSYVNWLRRMFKSATAADVFAGVYMTGILPIKKYKTESALNNFTEYSMVEPVNMSRFFGFTSDEVRLLARQHGMDYVELEKWYDGYQLGDEQSIFNPNSVIQAVYAGRCRSFWASTGAFEAVADYIQMDYEGLKDDIIGMLAGKRCKVNPTKFQNDMSAINSKDDVLTLLIHLGYLSYDWRKDECYIPNHEVAGEMRNAIESNNWQPVVDALRASEQLLKATLEGDELAVAKGIEKAHDEHTRILSYNDENSLSCVLSIAYYSAQNDYVIHRELPSGKGFADLVLIPRKDISLPAIILELKVDQHVESAIEQIHQKAYPAKVLPHVNHLLLVGISYDRKTKAHTCKIEHCKWGG